MKTIDMMKNLSVVVAVFVLGWNTCSEIRYIPEKDRNTTLEKTISSLKERVSNCSQNIQSTPEYLDLKNKLNLSNIKLEESKKNTAILKSQITEYTEYLDTAMYNNDIISKIDELRKDKQTVDQKLRCEVDNCYGFSSVPKKIDQAVVDTYKQQSADIQEQINLLITQLNNKT